LDLGYDIWEIDLVMPAKLGIFMEGFTYILPYCSIKHYRMHRRFDIEQFLSAFTFPSSVEICCYPN